MIVTALVLLAIGLAAGATTHWLRKKPMGKRLVPSVLATTAGLLAAVIAYAAVFEVGVSCDGRGDFGCQLNANQGVLTLLGLLLALGAVWTTVLTRFLDQRADRQALNRRVERAVVAAMEEARHNLLHVALSYDEDRNLGGLPAMSCNEAARLLQQPVRGELHSGLLYSAEQICRNVPMLERYADTEKTEWEELGVNRQGEPYAVEYLTNQSLGVLIWAGRTREEGHQFLHKPGLQLLHEAAAEDRIPKAYFRTSQDRLDAEAATLRTEGRVVACWWNDKPPERLKVFEFGPVFDDLSEGHAH